MGGDTERLILFSWFEVLWLSRRREVWGGGVTWSSRKSHLGLPEISSVVYLVKFKDRGHRVSCCFYFS